MKLYFLILDYQHGDNNAGYELIKRFSPLLKKYSRNFVDSDNANSELIFNFIKIIKSLPINNFINLDDKYLIKYIAISVKRSYFALLSKENKYSSKIFLVEPSEDFNTFIQNDENNLIFNDISKYLTAKEELVINKLFKDCCKEVEVAFELHTSRQNIYMIKRRALNKLKQYITI